MPLINYIKPEQIKVKLNLSHVVTGINKLSESGTITVGFVLISASLKSANSNKIQIWRY